MATIKDLMVAIDNYLSNPKLNNLVLFDSILNELSKNEVQRSELKLMIEQEKWLVQLSKAQKDGRIKSILDIFKKHDFKIPTGAEPTSNLLPFYVHPKNRADLRLKDFIAHPQVSTWDEVYSDHKPQLVSCTTEKGNTLDLVTYNVALTGPLMVNNIRDKDNTVQSSLWKGVVETKYNLNSFKEANESQSEDAKEIMVRMHAEREQRLIRTLKNQAMSGKPILLLQETSEDFANKLKKELGDGWGLIFSGNGKNIATLWDMGKLTLADEQNEENPKNTISSTNFNYQGEAITISNGHIPHATTAEEGEPVVIETLQDTTNHFFCGDFNRRLPPLDDGFHHNGTGNNNFNSLEEYDCTDGGFTFRDGQIVRLGSKIIDEQTGHIANRRDVTVAEALASDTFQECIFPKNYYLDGYHEKISRLNIEMDSMSLEKNIYNVSRVTIKSKKNIINELAKEFPYLEETKNSKGEFTYVIYTSPYVMQAKLINELNQNPNKNIDPLLKATNQALDSNSRSSLKQQALNDFKAATGAMVASKNKSSIAFKILSVVAAVATVALIASAILFLPPLGIAAGVTALIAAGFAAKGVSDGKKAKQITAAITAGELLINRQIEQERQQRTMKPLDVDSPSERKKAEEQIKASKNERLLLATGVSNQAQMIQQLMAKDKKMSVSKEEKLARIHEKTKGELRNEGATQEQIENALAKFTMDTPDHLINLAYQSTLSNVSRPIFDAYDSDAEINMRWGALSKEQWDNMSILEEHLDKRDYKQAAGVLKKLPPDIRQNIGMYFKPGSLTLESLKLAMLDKTFRDARVSRDVELQGTQQQENTSEINLKREEPSSLPKGLI
ncbi:hypothetical protein A6J40_13500 [Legionella longbeachae]|uniref:hypothetical protein n=1 Tax=Legionella longbeachae TaxID=450 RepID=UPI0009B7B89A|nr:hypothetical protein [Legionella longbeachae]ARB93125.1 hypothetical protein A6J40_13500 [Legionella longbeachae]RZV23967.1 hypothetical protein EKG34_12415 [Legionella longbeachae]UAK46977.1 hypothetical protein K8O86_01910 [Legionella longbeachae]VEE04021.1 Uncharacterised protein [Legionella oakridgensis]